MGTRVANLVVKTLAHGVVKEGGVGVVLVHLAMDCRGKANDSQGEISQLGPGQGLGQLA